MSTLQGRVRGRRGRPGVAKALAASALAVATLAGCGSRVPEARIAAADGSAGQAGVAGATGSSDGLVGAPVGGDPAAAASGAAAGGGGAVGSGGSSVAGSGGSAVVGSNPGVATSGGSAPVAGTGGGGVAPGAVTAPGATQPSAGAVSTGGTTSTGHGVTPKPGGTVAGKGSGGAAATPGGSAKSTAAAGNNGTTAPKAGTSAAPAAPVSATSPCTASLGPVVLGQTVAASGLVGAAIGNMRQGMAVWAKEVNSKGGVQCHPVQLYQADDGSDPAKVTSNLNDFVDNKHAVAIVGAGQRKFPFIGGDLIPSDWSQNQYLFSQGGGGLAAYAGSIKAAAQSKGATKLGLIYCVEASVCGDINNNLAQLAQEAGVSVVASKAASLTQTDYTSECQSMKTAGADVIFIALDGSGSARAARSCGSLSYHPPIATAGIAVSAQAAADTNLRADTVFLGTPVIPFTATDTPGGMEFAQAQATYAPGAPVDQASMLGYSSGKLFEAAMAQVASAARSGPITTPMVLQGLYALKGETLNGLSPGITFNPSGPTPAVNCYYVLRLDNNGFSAPNGSAKSCF